MRTLRETGIVTASEIDRADLFARIAERQRYNTMNDAHCWLVEGWDDGKGYKKIRFQGRAIFVHRAMYELLIGEIPKGLILDHKCRRRGCCNPLHLEPVTVEVNTARGNGAWIYAQKETSRCQQLPSPKTISRGTPNTPLATSVFMPTSRR